MHRTLKRIALVTAVSSAALALGGASVASTENREVGELFCETDKCFGGNECRDVGTEQTGCQVYGPFGSFCKTYDCNQT